MLHDIALWVVLEDGTPSGVLLLHVADLLSIQTHVLLQELQGLAGFGQGFARSGRKG